jgi:endonuclease YncB( thermonuclease family)
MKPGYIPLFLLACVALFVAAASPTPQIVLPARVVEVYDGDTPTVEVTFRMRIRLEECWCPEVTGKEKVEGLKSKKRMEELSLGKNGMVTIPLLPDIGQSTSMGRVVGRLSVEGKDLSEVMVKEGFATKEKPKAQRK